MKRKFLSILSLVLAIAMILPMGVFVSAEGPAKGDIVIDTTDIYDGGTKTTAKLSIKDITPTQISWSTFDTDIITLNPTTGEVTGKKAGTANVTATYRYTEGEGENAVEKDATASTTVTVKEYKIASAAIDTDKTKTNFVEGQSISKSDITVVATYTDGSTGAITSFDYSPKTVAADTTEIKVTVNGLEGELKFGITVAKVNPSDFVKSISIEYPKSTTEFTVGEKLKKSDIQVKITLLDTSSSVTTPADNSNITVSGISFDSTGSHTFSNEEAKTNPTLTVSYTGLSTPASVTLKVKEKQTETEKPSTSIPSTVEMGNAPTKKSYTVGEKFDPANMTVKVLDGTGKQLTVSGVFCSEYTFTSADVGKTSITVYVSFNYGGASYYKPVTVKDLTITAAAETLAVASIEEGGVELENSKYPIGYIFTLSNIYRVYYYKSSSLNSRSYISGYDIVRGAYTNDFELQVLGSNGKTKSKNINRIEEDDVLTDSKGGTYVQLRFYIDSKYIDFDVDVGSSGVSYYYDDDLITVYEDIVDALDYTITQDKNVSGFILSLVKDSKNIVLKLGEDQSISSTYDDFDPEHNIVIDLNGHSLTFYTDTVNITKSNSDYTITITNTSSTAGKFIYEDEDITMTVAKNEKLVFEYDKDIPGIYTVTLDVGSNGSVVTTPKASDDEITVGHGTDIKFTITPASGYTVNTIKADSKTVSSTDYTKSSTGVVTYTLKAVSKSQTVEISFKKDETKWNNPFTDVKSTDSYYSAVQFVYENELFKGTTTTKFSPDTTMTRAMFVTVLGRLANVDVSRYKTSSYSDVPLNNDTAWYAPYVEWATNMGLVEGYGDGTFGPNNKITHQQMYVLMYRYTIFVENKSVTLKSTSINASDAEDVADWAKDAVKFASQNNFLVKISTTSSRIDPTGEAKRSELAQLLEQYCKIILGWDK